MLVVMGTPPSGAVQASAMVSAVQNEIVAVAAVYAQKALVGGQHGAYHGGAVLFILRRGLEVADEVYIFLAEGVGNLLVELVDVIASDRVHEERAHDDHQ